MARDTDSLLVRKWATASGAVLETPEASGLTRAVGFPAAYGEDMARSLGLFNQQVREVSAAFVEIAQRGILEWNAAQRYEHQAWVTGSDGNLYRSVRSSGGPTQSQNPVVDLNSAYWLRFVLSVPTSTTARRGTIERATVAEARAGTDTERAVTPAGAAAAIADAPRPLWL